MLQSLAGLSGGFPSIEQIQARRDEMFAALDTDQSGGLSTAELEGQKFGDRLIENFDKIDTDGSLELQKEELSAFVEDKRADLAERIANGKGQIEAMMTSLLAQSGGASEASISLQDSIRAYRSSLSVQQPSI